MANKKTPPGARYQKDSALKARLSKNLKAPSEISPLEFRFCELDEQEFAVCRNYEFGRERELGRKYAIGEHRKAINKPRKRYPPEQLVVAFPDLKDLVLKVRQGWKVADGGSPFSAQNPNWLQCPESRVLVLYREWPESPYLSIPKEERLKRIATLSLEPERAEDPMAFVARIQRELRETVGEDKEADERRRALLDRLKNVASLIQLDSSGAKCKKLIAIPLHEIEIGPPVAGADPTERVQPVYRKDVEAAFSACLTINFPQLPDEKERGRRSGPCDDLNALAVYRLRRAGKKLDEIKDSVREPGSGRGRGTATVYSSIKKLKRPRDRLPGRVADFYKQVIADLEPLEPSTAPDPDSIPWPWLSTEESGPSDATSREDSH
jgi:hypothetical protein